MILKARLKSTGKIYTVLDYDAALGSIVVEDDGGMFGVWVTSVNNFEKIWSEG